jgi:hypothetical protein
MGTCKQSFLPNSAFFETLVGYLLDFFRVSAIVPGHHCTWLQGYAIDELKTVWGPKKA